MSRLIHINENSPKPIYVQIQDSIIKAIRSDLIKPGSQLPSINEISDGLNIARKTAEKSYNELKRKNILVSVPGKGYFVSENSKLDQKKVMLMFDIMNLQNNVIHQSFMKSIKDHNLVDFLVYHKDIEAFGKYLMHAPDEYSHYVIMGHFNDKEEDAVKIINQLPKHKLIILDRNLKGIVGDYSSITQNFSNIIHNALSDMKDGFVNFNKLCIVFPKFTYYPEDTLKGVINFATESDMSFEVIKKIDDYVPKKGEVFLTMTEKELASTLLKLQENNLEIGKEVGVVSYTDHPLNQIVIGGITAISPNFEEMGRLAAEAILSDKKTVSSIGYQLRRRKSL
jgi:DNA-binding transcriptional regulator YhcF (GntR family)